MLGRYYAHSLPGKLISEWQTLDQHLEKVAKLAAEFARPFGGDAWARLLGAGHDIGKGTFP